MDFSLGSLIFLFGAIQAVILIIGINIRKPLYSDLKKVTTLLLLVITVVLLYYTFVLNRVYAVMPFIDSLGSACWMAIAPSFYLLCLSVKEPKWALHKRHITYFAFSFIFILEEIFTTFNFNAWQFFISTADQYLDCWMFLFFSSGLFFMSRCLMLFSTDEEEPKNRELKWFVLLFLGLLLVYGILYLFIRNNYVSLFETSMIALFELFIFVLVYRVFKIAPFQQFFEMNKYSTASLSKAQMSKLASKLESVMQEEKPYLDKKLNLNKLATLSNISSNDLSQLFNLYYRSNFYEYINRYRVDHFENILQDPSYQQFKIIALAEESGFNSKATFYKAFKDKHELTPMQFIKKYKS